VQQVRWVRGRGGVQWAGLVAGPALAAGVFAILPEGHADAQGHVHGLLHAGRATAALTVWMAVWWMTEAIAVYATALLPLAVLPAVGATSMSDAAAPYGHELIYLFMGGFVLALSMQRWGLDRRISLLALRWVGSGPHAVVGGFMAVTAGLSMWVSNTATAVMMLPIAIGVIELAQVDAGDPEEGERFAVCLLLGIAYAASIGGVGTLVGTPPNLFLASYVRSELGLEISFARWLAIGLPFVVCFLPLTWLLLTRLLFPLGSIRIEGGSRHIDERLREMGAMKAGEWATLVVFGVTASAWILRPLLVELSWGGHRPLAGLTDPGIAITAALALFVIPVRARERVFVMDWPTAAGLPWGLLVLFGGGLSLAAAIRANGVGEFLGQSAAGLAGLPAPIVMLALVSLMIFLTEITSNTATAATLIPIVAGLAPGLGIEALLLVVPVAIAASCAFMLPVATPPNAVVFGSGRVSVPQMCRAGLWLNVAGIGLISGLCYALVLPVLARAAH